MSKKSETGSGLSLRQIEEIGHMVDGSTVWAVFDEIEQDLKELHGMHWCYECNSRRFDCKLMEGLDQFLCPECRGEKA